MLLGVLNVSWLHDWLPLSTRRWLLPCRLLWLSLCCNTLLPSALLWNGLLLFLLLFAEASLPCAVTDAVSVLM